MIHYSNTKGLWNKVSLILIRLPDHKLWNIYKGILKYVVETKECRYQYSQLFCLTMLLCLYNLNINKLTINTRISVLYLRQTRDSSTKESSVTPEIKGIRPKKELVCYAKLVPCKYLMVIKGKKIKSVRNK